MNQKSEHAPDTKVDTEASPEPEEKEGATAEVPETEAPASEPTVTPEVEKLLAELEVARHEVADNLDKFLRAKAEVENTRRRAEIDVASAHKYALERFAGEILAVKDSLELARAVDIAEENQTALEKMHEGLDLTLKLMDTIFQKFGLITVDPKGERFDPEKHQAISMVESDEIAPNHVVNVVQKGYMLHDRVLRPAMVIVARAKAAAADSGDQAENT